MFDRLAELRAKRENGEGGFTLIELLVVVVIIGILIAIAIPLYLNYKKNAADDSAQSDVRGAVAALEACQANGTTYPSATGATTVVPATPCTGQRINTSDGNTVTYLSDGTGYMLRAYNGNGNTSATKFFCYASAVGGAPKLTGAASTTWPAAYSATFTCN